MPTLLEFQKQKRTGNTWKDDGELIIVGPATPDHPDVLIRKPKSPGIYARLTEQRYGNELFSMVTAFTYLQGRLLSADATWIDDLDLSITTAGELRQEKFLPARESDGQWKLTRVLKIEK